MSEGAWSRWGDSSLEGCSGKQMSPPGPPLHSKRTAGASVRFAKSWSQGPATLPRMGTSGRPGYICPCQFPPWTMFRAHFQGKCCAFKEVTLWANFAFTRMDEAQWGLLSLMEAELRCQWLSREINSLTSPQAYNVKLFFFPIFTHRECWLWKRKGGDNKWWPVVSFFICLW